MLNFWILEDLSILKAIQGGTGRVWTQWPIKKSVFCFIYIYIYIYISNKILEEIQLVSVVYDYLKRKELFPAQIHLQRLRTTSCLFFSFFLESIGYCFTNWIIIAFYDLSRNRNCEYAIWSYPTFSSAGTFYSNFHLPAESYSANEKCRFVWQVIYDYVKCA